MPKIQAPAVLAGVTVRPKEFAITHRSSHPGHAVFAALLVLLPAALAPAANADGIRVHGLLDFTATGRGNGLEANSLTRGDSPFDPWGLRVFGEGPISPRIAVFTQGVLHDPSGPYVEGAYVTITPSPTRDMQLEVGKIPFPIGTYAPRSYSDKNPLIGKPLMYQYHTTLLWYAPTPSAEELLAAAGGGQNGGGYLGPGSQGMPVVDDSYWDAGVVFSGSARPVEYAAGVTLGTPGWGNTGEDENRGKTLVGRLGLAPIPSLRAGVSGAYGAYLVEGADPYLPDGKTANDYHQRLLMGDADFELGHVVLRGEGYANTWQTPTVGDLKVHGGYVEGQFTLTAGFWLAARGEVMRFSTVSDSTGAALPWDLDRNRTEIGIGYRPEKDVRLKAVWQSNVEKPRTPGTEGEHYSLLALQLSIQF